MNYDIFISYRRNGGYDVAKHLNDLLVRDGYKVSFDIDTLRSGDFDKQLLSRIDDCKDFILIVDAHAFDRTIDPNQDPNQDWLRCELAYALKRNKNIIPVFLSGPGKFPSNLPDDISQVVKKNGPTYELYHFDSFYKELKQRFIRSLPFRKIIVYSLLVAIIGGLICVGILYGNRKYNSFYPKVSVGESAYSSSGDYFDREQESVSPEHKDVFVEKEPEKPVDNRRHMDYAGLPMNTDIDSYVQSLKEQGFVSIERNADYCQLVSSRKDTIFVFYDKQNNNQVMGVSELEGQFDISYIGDFVMGFVESFPDSYEDFMCEDEYGCIDFSYGRIVVGENLRRRGTLVFQYIDRINTDDYRLWFY